MSKLPNEEERTRFLQLCLRFTTKWLVSPVDAKKDCEFWTFIAGKFKTTDGRAVFTKPAQLMLTKTALLGNARIQARKEMADLCNHRRWHPPKNKGRNRSRLQVAKDDVIKVWRTIDLIQSMANFKLLLVEAMGDPVVRAIRMQVNAANVAGARDDGQERDDDDDDGDVLPSLFQPQVVKVLEAHVTALMPAPSRATPRATPPRARREETISDDGENEVGGIAIPSIEQEADEDENEDATLQEIFLRKSLPPESFRSKDYHRVGTAFYKDPSFSPHRTRSRTEADRKLLEAEAKLREEQARRHRRNMNQTAQLPTPPTSSQPAPSSTLAEEDVWRIETDDEEEEGEEEDVEESDDGGLEASPMLLHAGHPLGLASSPLAPEADDIMGINFSEFIYDPYLPHSGPSASGPPQPPSSPPGPWDARLPTRTNLPGPPSSSSPRRSPTYSPLLNLPSSSLGGPPSVILGARSTPGQTPAQDLRHHHPTPAARSSRSESGLFVPQTQKKTPVPPPRPWDYVKTSEQLEQAKREETFPPLSVIAAQGRLGQKNATCSPSQPAAAAAAERQMSSAVASEPKASRPSSGAAETSAAVSAEGSSATDRGSQGATEKGQQRRAGSTPKQPKQSKQPKRSADSDVATAAGADAVKNTNKPKKGNGKKEKAKKPNGKEKGKAKEKEVEKDLEKEVDAGNRPAPAAADTRAEYALPNQFGDMGKPRHARYIGAPAFADVSMEDLRRREVTTILPPNPVPQRPAAPKPAPVVEAHSRTQDEPAIPSSSSSSSQSRASRLPLRGPRDNAVPDIHDRPDEQTQKQQQTRQCSVSLPFSGTHIHFDEDGDTIMEVWSPSPTPAVAAPARPQTTWLDAPWAQSASHPTAEDGETPRNQRKRPHSKVSRGGSVVQQPSAARLPSREPAREGWQRGPSPAKRRKEYHGKGNRGNSITVSSVPAAAPRFTPEDHHRENSAPGERRQQRHSTTHRRDPPAPRPDRRPTPKEWKDSPVSGNQRKRPHGRAFHPRQTPVPVFVSSPNRESASESQGRQPPTGDIRNKTTPNLPARPPSVPLSSSTLAAASSYPFYPSSSFPPPSSSSSYTAFSSTVTPSAAPPPRDEQHSNRRAPLSSGPRGHKDVITAPRRGRTQTDAAMTEYTAHQGGKKALPLSMAERAERDALLARLEQFKENILSNYSASPSAFTN